MQFFLYFWIYEIIIPNFWKDTSQNLNTSFKSFFKFMAGLKLCCVCCLWCTWCSEHAQNSMWIIERINILTYIYICIYYISHFSVVLLNRSPSINLTLFSLADTDISELTLSNSSASQPSQNAPDSYSRPFIEELWSKVKQKQKSQQEFIPKSLFSTPQKHN